MTPRLITPSGLAPHQPFWLAGRKGDPTRERLRAILAHAAPEAICIEQAEPPAEGTIVLFEMDAFATTGRLVDAGIAAERIRYLPLAESYPWAYWDAWGWFEARPELYADLSSFDAFRVAASTCAQLNINTVCAHRWTDLAAHPAYWNHAAGEFSPYESQVAIVHDRLADEASRRLYELVYRSDPRELWGHFVTSMFSQFDYLEHGRPEDGDTVLNLGIFTGHEVPSFMTLVGETGQVYDVDPLGHDLLSDYTRGVIGTRPQGVHEARFAAGARHDRGSFSRCLDGQVSLATGGRTGDETFAIAPLDDYIEAAGIGPIDFIKMDVEGMELEALAGLNRTIRRDRPRLSLAIYHHPAHFWGLPMLLMKQLQDYDFYIDHFSPQRWETVLTAVPRERPITFGTMN